MITKFLKSILLAAALLATMPATAYDFMADGLCYDLNSDSTSVTVTYESNGNFNSPYYNSLSGNITIPKTVYYHEKNYSVTSIGQEAFHGCSDLTCVTIPNSVSAIGWYAFEDCTGLTSITIPNSVTSLEARVFYGCTSMTSITIPNSVTSIKSYAFSGCSGLTNITIPNSVTTIGEGAFDGTPWYNEQLDGLVYAGLIAYKYKGTIPSGTNITLKENTVSIANRCFDRCNGLTNITIPNSVTSIGQEAFSGTPWYNAQPNGLVYAGLVAYKYKGTMPNETSITLKPGTKAIADYCFSYCSGLTKITIPNSVTTIGSRAFGVCSGLTRVTIPNSVTSVSDYAFASCSGLTSLTIPNSVTTIGSGAFFRCSGLTSINCRIKNPHNVTLGSSVFYDVNKSDCRLKVPASSVDLYKEADQWKDFVNIVPIEEPGDVSGDGVVSGADVTALYNVLLDGAESSGDADVNGDDMVNGADVTALYNLLLGQ